MAILNPDGTPFVLTGSLQQFDPGNPEFDLFNTWDQEAIAIGGTPIFYYEVFLQTNTIDPLFYEDRGKVFSNNPICLMGFYDPIPSQNYVNMFGIDSPDEILINFNYQDVINKVGHVLKTGSRLFTAHKRENWEIIQRNVEEFRMWGQLRLQVMCKRFQESTTMGEGKVTQKSPDFKID